MCQKLYRHISCVKHSTRRAAKIGATKIVCARGYCHRVTSLVDRQRCLQQKKEKKKENSQSPLHPVQEVAQKQGHFTDNLLGYRCIWFGCLDNSCYATQRFTFFLSYSEKSVCT